MRRRRSREVDELKSDDSGILPGETLASDESDSVHSLFEGQETRHLADSTTNEIVVADDAETREKIRGALTKFRDYLFERANEIQNRNNGVAVSLSAEERFFLEDAAKFHNLLKQELRGNDFSPEMRGLGQFLAGYYDLEEKRDLARKSGVTKELFENSEAVETHAQFSEKQDALWQNFQKLGLRRGTFEIFCRDVQKFFAELFKVKTSLADLRFETGMRRLLDDSARSKKGQNFGNVLRGLGMDPDAGRADAPSGVL
jgi:hypothetical protein